MARIRSIHPGLFTDEAFVSLSTDAQVLLFGIYTEADDQGVFEWKPITLRMRLRPTKDGAIDPMLAEMEVLNIVRKYEVNGRHYGAIRNFRKYQRPKKPNAVHPITDEIRTYVALTTSSSELDDVEDDEIPQKGELAPQMEEVGGRREEEGDKQHTPVQDPVCVDFDRWLEVFPKKTEKAAAKTAFTEALKKTSIDGLLRAAEAYAASVKGKDLRYVKGPAAWLIEGRWTDDLTKRSERKAAPAAVHPSWNGRQAALVAKIGDDKFGAWFAASRLDLGPPTVIEVGSGFLKTEIEKKFSAPLRALFGSVEIAVVRDVAS